MTRMLIKKAPYRDPLMNGNRAQNRFCPVRRNCHRLVSLEVARVLKNYVVNATFIEDAKPPALLFGISPGGLPFRLPLAPVLAPLCIRLHLVEFCLCETLSVPDEKVGRVWKRPALMTSKRNRYRL